MSFCRAVFFKKSEDIFDGTLTGPLALSITLETPAYIRLTGNTEITALGYSHDNVEVSEVVRRLSKAAFSRIREIIPSDPNGYLGKISVVDSSGVAVPIDRKLFSLMVNFSNPGIRATSVIRTQQDIGISTSDEIVQIIVTNSGRPKSLEVSDYVKIKGKKYIIRAVNSITASYWVIQAVMET